MINDCFLNFAAPYFWRVWGKLQFLISDAWAWIFLSYFLLFSTLGPVERLVEKKIK
jgi:hypothetical protein